MAAKRSTKRSMSDAHKEALAQGRSEGRAVRNYLEGLRATAPQRGRRRTVDGVDRRMAAIEVELVDADPMRQLKLVQERRDLQTERESMQSPVEIEALEAGFVDVAKSYSDRQGITYQSWREVGVPAAVLARAGISRSR